MGDHQQAKYEQIETYLRGLIAHATPGDRLPSEAELCAQFDVSRMTARQAMQLVAAEGLVDRRRGAGTFVRSTPVPRDLGSPLSFSGSMRARGMSASSRTLTWAEGAPTSDEATALSLSSGASTFVLERVRFADSIAMALERVVMPKIIAVQLPDGFEVGSLHDAFRSIGLWPTEAHAEVSARRASKREQDLLGLPQSGIVISELRTIFDQDDRALERTETCYAANRYSFRAILRDVQGQR